MFFIPKIELSSIANQLSSYSDTFKNTTFLVTGGTGFIGKWLVAALNQLNLDKNLNIKIYILTRKKEPFLNKFAECLNVSNIYFIESDIRDLKNFDNLNINFDYIILGANDATYDFGLDPFLVSDTLISGTCNLLERCVSKNTKAILHLSSGAVYGDISNSQNGAKESSYSRLNINDVGSIYGAAKILVESILNQYGKSKNITILNARCFAFSGPYLPLDKHFAFGNFINSALTKKDIVINGDGSPIRSYLYPTDLVCFLLRLVACSKKSTSVNVGSSKGLSIKDLALKIKHTLNLSNEVIIKNKNVSHPEKSNFYLPNTDYAKSLGFSENVTLGESIIRTYNFYKNLN